MKTLKQFALVLAVALAAVVTLAVCESPHPDYFAGAVTVFAIMFAATHGVASWQRYRPGVFSAELTFPFDRSGAPLGAKIDQGCLSCPTGYAYGADTAINTLERVTNNVLTLGFKDYNMPMFPLAGLPVQAARTNQLTGIRRVRPHVFFENVHRAKWYSPVPEAVTFDTMRKLIDQCGGSVATARLIANSNSIGCAPPRGPRGVSGKDALFQDAATTVFELGPFCITDFLELEGFQAHMSAYKAAAIKAAGMALEYEKIRRFVSMSKANGAAVAGTSRPRFSSSNFTDIPNSPGSLEWLANSIDTGIGGEIRHGTQIEVNVSRQLFQYWLEKFKKDHDIIMELDVANFAMQIKGFITSFDNDGGFIMQSKRTNRKIRISTTKDPVYVEIYKNADGTAEWDFQAYYVTQVGDDSDTNQANGFRQSMNTAYGDAAAFCEGETKRLAEMILINTSEAFHYEAFPTNPLAANIPGDVEANLQRLWGATEMNWFFGADVDLYYLKALNDMIAGTGAPCFSNIDKTWFAGRIKTGLMFIEDDPRQMMTLLVAVPGESSVIEKSEVCLPCEPPPAVVLTPRPALDPVLCEALPNGVTEDTGDAGCMRAPARLQFTLPSSGNKTVSVLFERRDGSTGTLTVPFSIVDGTALEGAGSDKHFLLADGNVVFLDGETEKQVDIVLHPFIRGAGDPKFVQAIMRYDNAPIVICGEEGGTVDTTLCFMLADVIAGDGDDCPSAYCLQCADVPLESADVMMALKAERAKATKKAAKKAAKKTKGGKPAEQSDDTNPYQVEE